MNKETIYKGIAASPGISIGKAYLYTRSNFDVDRQILMTEEIDKELEEFNNALELSMKELNKIRAFSYKKIGERNSLIFDSQLEILNDRFFISNIINRIQNEKRTSSFIFDEEMTKIGEVLLSSNDEYLRERSSDINDVRSDALDEEATRLANEKRNLNNL